MIQCSKCQTYNSSGSVSCGICGAPLEECVACEIGGNQALGECRARPAQGAEGAEVPCSTDGERASVNSSSDGAGGDSTADMVSGSPSAPNVSGCTPECERRMYLYHSADCKTVRR